MRFWRCLLLCFSAGFGGPGVAWSAPAQEAVWQWSVPVGESRAFLWIPEKCGRVRAVLLAQHNMIERPILEHPAMRRNLAECGIAEVFLVPGIDPVFRFDQGTGGRFDGILRALADVSGYGELATAPVAPMGHSAHASFPWNFAAWNPGRTLAVLSVKGDAPVTDLTGSGRPNPDWGTSTLDGVPGLMVMSEYEWWDARLAPLMKYHSMHPAAPLAVLADAGHGHFDASDGLVGYLALFLRKAATARLPADGAGPLRAVDPTNGWLVDRWRGDEAPHSAAAPNSTYGGDRAEAFWCFDGEMARTTEACQATGRGKKKQEPGFRQNDGFVPISNSHAGTELQFQPDADGITFRLDAGFITPLPPNPPTATKDKRPPVVTVMPEPAAAGTHAPGSVRVSKIIGPVAETGPGTFRVSLDRMFPAADRRPMEVWFLASHPGDEAYKSAVRQAMMRLRAFTEGAVQAISFPAIADRKPDASAISLTATADSGLPVGYYVREGPAFVQGDTLHLTTIPPRAKLPVRVTVVAWQFGRGAEPKIQAAEPVERSFLIRP